MKVLVTGNEGYLGVVAVAALRAAGHDVHGLDSGLFRTCTLGAEPPSHVDVQNSMGRLKPAPTLSLLKPAHQGTFRPLLIRPNWSG